MRTVELAPNPEPQPSPALRLNLPASVGQGGLRIESFSSGIQLAVMDAKFERQVCLKADSSGYTAGFGFCLTGGFESRPACFNDPIPVKSGSSAFFYYPELTDLISVAAPEPMRFAYIVMKTETLYALAEGSDGQLAPIVKQMGKGCPFLVPDIVTPAMRMVFHQIFNCPYTGAIRRIYLEGKVMELLAQKLDQLRGRESFLSGRPASLKPSDIERIRHAADLLVRNLEDPPDMKVLARSAGLSRSKLYRDFPKVYGLSPFDYLRSRRLQTAMHLLQAGEINVTEAALRVGYANLSHFAKAFRSMFGVSPKELLQS